MKKINLAALVMSFLPVYFAYTSSAQAYDVEFPTEDNTIYILLVNDNPGAVFHSISIATPETFPSFVTSAEVTIVPETVVGGGSALAAVQFNTFFAPAGTTADFVLSVSGQAAGAAINFDVTVPLTVVASAAAAQGQVGTGIPVPDPDGVDTDNDGVSDALEVSFGSDPQSADSTPSNPNIITDTDGDGYDDLVDTCPTVFNLNQSDTDNDGLGDKCDSTPNGDTDEDGIDNLEDNCPSVANADQADTDNDGTGNVCDSTPNGDDDLDGFDNSTDNCPSIANADQTDTDADGAGDVCDSTPNGDDDLDGLDNNADNCPADANADQLDSDSDGTGDVCDASPFGDEVNEEFIPMVPTFGFGLLAILLAIVGLPLTRKHVNK